METIEIGYYGVAGTRWNHQYFLYTPSEGPRQFLRGGPDVDGLSIVLGTSNILVEWGDYTPKVEDYDSNGTHKYKTILQGQNLSLYWDKMIQQGRLINEAEFPYYFMAQNSGTVIRAVSEYANLQMPADIDTANRDFPGMENLLPTANTAAGFVLQAESDGPKCFVAGTEITMWDGSKKPIESIRPNDWVLSHDKNGNPVPGRVSRTFTNEAKIILDFHGTFVTPGHVYYCAGGKYQGRFAPLMDILRDDGVVQHEDGTLIRAATGCTVGSDDDREFWAYTVYENAQGPKPIKDGKKLRLGTRWMQPDGHHVSMREYMANAGLELLDDRFVRSKETGQKTLFIWPFSDTLPNPEDFVLARSQTTLEDIYGADQWESMHPTMPEPLVRDGGPVAPLSEHQLNAMPRNMPMAFENESPSSALQSSRPRMNRKQRLAEEAKMRSATKARRKAMH